MQQAEKPLIIYLIAGEASGDLLGAHLMRELKQQSPRPIKFFGIGGPRMQDEGLKSLFPFYELSMMGFLEILPHMFNLAARIRLTVDDIRAKWPDAVVTIDSPGFCFRVVERVRKEKIDAKFIHYVAPTVWAYKPERAKRCKRLFDHMLLLLPFEPPYFEKVGLACTFIGHPVIVETPIGNGQAFRDRYQIAPDVPIFALFPGSRKGEVDRHMPIFARAITLLAHQYPNLALAVAVPQNVLPFVAPYFKSCPFRAVIMSNEQDKKDAIAASTLALVKSGTVSLEVALHGTPMVVAYRVNPISAWLVKRMLLTRYVNLINILQQKEIIPELLQSLCTGPIIADAMASFMYAPSRMARQKEHMATALQRLLPPSPPSPSAIAAKTVLKTLSL